MLQLSVVLYLAENDHSGGIVAADVSSSFVLSHLEEHTPDALKGLLEGATPRLPPGLGGATHAQGGGEKNRYRSLLLGGEGGGESEQNKPALSMRKRRALEKLVSFLMRW